ncbi:MAG: hypothetical protein HFJ02_02740 [Bacilli bacterium]|nr:hypothetical protein [Bacilli bacterium]
MDNETFNEVRVEDYIWIIYIFLAIFALVSNHYEKEYLKKHEKKDENIFRTINTEIFIVTFIIYIYFAYINFKHIKRLNRNSSLKEIILANAGLVAALLFLIGGGISLAISVIGDDEDDFFLNFF